jgi:UDP-2,3-diacylglucosamine pyrophosphatase LpxH
MRALVISDTHFGAWTGEDILREPQTLALLEPHLDVDEVILLGDMFDLLFGSLRDSLHASQALLRLLREKLQGRRFVFLAGNHDHHFVVQELEELVGLEFVSGKSADAVRGDVPRLDVLRCLLESSLEGVEVEVRYPSYMFGDVLCTHGHYLDFHTDRSGARPSRLLARTLWSVAVGGEQRRPMIEEYEATVKMLTGLLYTIAQLPNGTDAQRRVFATFHALERAAHLSGAPVRAFEEAGTWVANRLGLRALARRSNADMERGMYQEARSREAKRQQQTGAPASGMASSYAFARSVAPSDPSAPALAAFEKVVANLGWAREADKIVFAHTHQPLDGVTGPGGAGIRYWNTGSWIYEPDLRSRETYLAYLRNAWPGTVVLIDADEPHPRLLRLREHLKPMGARPSRGGQ